MNWFWNQFFTFQKLSDAWKIKHHVKIQTMNNLTAISIPSQLSTNVATIAMIPTLHLQCNHFYNCYNMFLFWSCQCYPFHSNVIYFSCCCESNCSFVTIIFMIGSTSSNQHCFIHIKHLGNIYRSMVTLLHFFMSLAALASPSYSLPLHWSCYIKTYWLSTNIVQWWQAGTAFVLLGYFHV